MVNNFKKINVYENKTLALDIIRRAPKLIRFFDILDPKDYYRKLKNFMVNNTKIDEDEIEDFFNYEKLIKDKLEFFSIELDDGILSELLNIDNKYLVFFSPGRTNIISNDFFYDYIDNDLIDFLKKENIMKDFFLKVFSGWKGFAKFNETMSKFVSDNKLQSDIYPELARIVVEKYVEIEKGFHTRALIENILAINPKYIILYNENKDIPHNDDYFTLLLASLVNIMFCSKIDGYTKTVISHLLGEYNLKELQEKFLQVWNSMSRDEIIPEELSDEIIDSFLEIYELENVIDKNTVRLFGLNI